jgi:hypothetical protein
MQPAHPQHAEYIASRDRPMVATDASGKVLGVEKPLLPFRPIRMGGWEEAQPGEWRNIESPDDEFWIDDAKLAVQTGGTYGEGGFVQIPLTVLQMCLEHHGWRLKRPQQN